MSKGIQILGSAALITTLFFSCTGDPVQDESAGTGSFPLLSAEFTELNDISEGLQVGVLEMNTGVQHLLPAYQFWYERFSLFPESGYNICSELRDRAGDPAALMYLSFRLLGSPAGGYGPPLSGIMPLTGEISLRIGAGGEEQWELLPPELKEGIRGFVTAWEQSAMVLQQFTDPLLDALNLQVFSGDQARELLMEPWLKKQLYSFNSVDLIQKSDLRKLSFASRILSASMQELSGLYPVNPSKDFKGCVLETELGSIGIFGPGSDTITSGHSLVIDLGGDDIYTGDIACPGFNHPISLVLDYSGNDRYLPGDGALLLASPGIGMLFDLDGDDHYYTDRPGLASAAYGCAILYDFRGDDSYIGTAGFTQGAAHVGVALLADLQGDDSYNCTKDSQGYGGTLGVGILIELSGEDHYNLGSGNPSFVLGAARGRWAEFTDGHSLGGGLGIFVEAGGSDRYHAGSFSQGASYFTGTGLFADLSGDDQYLALSHSQAYAAHYGLSGFFEMKGNDRYNAGSDPEQITQLLGNGRDLSAACFVEEEGNDTYHMGNRSGGIGDLKGIGLLWDRQGDDLFIWHRNAINAGSPSLGHSIGLSEGMAIGSRSPVFPEGRPTGWFRVMGKCNLQIEDEP